MIGVSVSVCVFLTVLVLGVVFIAWYRMKVKFQKVEVVGTDELAEGGTANGNLVDVELDNLNEQTADAPRSLSSDDSVRERDV